MRASTARDTASWCPICGFTSRATSRGLAVHALRIHSCDRHRSLAERRARGVAQRARMTYELRPCLHKNTKHQHGTPAAYVLDGCRCRPCGKARAAYELRRHRQQGYGTWQPFVDARPVREHVEQLQAAGLGLKRIAKLSGVSHGGLTKLIYGAHRPDGTYRPSERLRPATAAALLAVTVDLEVLGARISVDGTGTRRRLQALVALGWPKLQLAVRLGMQPGNFGRTLNHDRVWASTARATKKLYAELHDQLPPETSRTERSSASRARNYAKARGWLTPGWWDDDTIDDPTFTPVTVDPPRHWSDIDPMAVERACAGDDVPLTRAERIRAILELHDRGMNQLAIGRRLGIPPRRIGEVIVEHGERVAS